MGDEEFSITAVVTAAAHGDQAAWNDIVDRFSPLLAAVLHQCGLSRADAEDAAQTVWLRLVENLDKLERHGLCQCGLSRRDAARRGGRPRATVGCRYRIRGRARGPGSLRVGTRPTTWSSGLSGSRRC